MEKLNNHIKSDKMKWIVVSVAFVIIFALLGGLIAAVVTDTKPQDWVKKDACEHKYADGVCTVCGEKEPVKKDNPLVLGDVVESGMLLSAGEAVTASDGSVSQTLTATQNSQDNKMSVSWTVAFVNPTSTWATGKTVTDYVIVTESPTDQFVATVTCLQAFGEQVVVTVSSDYTNASASCKVDYLKRLTALDIDVRDNVHDALWMTMHIDNHMSSSDTIITSNNNYFVGSSDGQDTQPPTYAFELRPIYTDGTIASTDFYIEFGYQFLDGGSVHTERIKSGDTVMFTEQSTDNGTSRWYNQVLLSVHYAGTEPFEFDGLIDVYDMMTTLSLDKAQMQF